jgi:hypothetical protein
LSETERERISAFLFHLDERWEVRGPAILEIWLVEQRMKAERLASDRLARATWYLVGATAALVLATLALLFGH